MFLNPKGFSVFSFGFGFVFPRQDPILIIWAQSAKYMKVGVFFFQDLEDLTLQSCLELSFLVFGCVFSFL